MICGSRFVDEFDVWTLDCLDLFFPKEIAASYRLVALALREGQVSSLLRADHAGA